MTVSTTVSRLFRLGNGSTTFFPFDVGFGYTDPTDILVYVGNAQLTYGTDYTVSTSGVILTVPPASSAVITIQRLVPATQQVDYQTLDTFPANTHEGALDKLTYLIQQLADAQTRSLILPATEPGGTSTVLPDKATRVNKNLGFDASGNLVAAAQLSNLYLGPLVADPLSTTVGALYFNSVTNKFRAWNGTIWFDVISNTNGLLNVYRYTATSSQTVFSGNDIAGLVLAYDPGFIAVYDQGVLQDKSTYTATNGTSITFNTGRTAGNRITIEAFGVFTLGNGTVTGFTLAGTTAVTGQMNFSGTRAQRDASAESLGVSPYGYGPKNYWINGNFNVCQRFDSQVNAAVGRGMSTTANALSSSFYIMDRIYQYFTGSVPTWNTSRQAHTLGSVFGSDTPDWYMQHAITVPAGTSMGFGQRIESLRRTATKTMTLSFWARTVGSARSVSMSVDQRFGTGGSPSAPVNVTTQAFALTSTATKFTKTFTVPSIAGKTLGADANSDFLDFNFNYPLASETYQFWGFDLREGSSAPARTEDLGVEYETFRASRYFRVLSIDMAAQAQSAGIQSNIRSTQPLYPPMRTNPLARVSGNDNLAAEHVVIGTANNLVARIPAAYGNGFITGFNANGEAISATVEAVSAPGIVAFSYTGFTAGVDAELY